MTTLDDAINQLEEFGLDIGGVPIADGRVHRCNYQGERKKSGWYVLHQDVDLFYGSYGSWKVREEGFSIMRRNAAALDSRKYQELKQDMLNKAIQRRQAKRHAQAKAAERAVQIWESSSEEGTSPYLERKGCFAHGARFHGSTLIIPMVREGKIRSLQSIGASGFKKFLPGGEVSGCFFMLRGSKKKVALCEGFATGSTIHQATGWTVIVCFSASNLPKVGPYFWTKDVRICADNDEAGITYAKRAAERYEWDVHIPPKEGQDFNDMTVEEVKKCLM
jgi:putative DNA primase/helicase